MKLQLADATHADKIYELVQTTIEEVYPNYYLPEIVNFFLQHHSYENILKDISAKRTTVLLVAGKLVGTGTVIDNQINRIFVDPKHQHRGYGKKLMATLENKVKNDYPTVMLDASLPATTLYEYLGYQTLRHEQLPVADGKFLVFDIMEKSL